MTVQDKKRDLLIVITRDYANRGDLMEDEFCILWGYPEKSEYEWKTQTEGVALLLIHGCKEWKPQELIIKALNPKSRPPNLDLTGQVWLYCHSDKPKSLIKSAQNVFQENACCANLKISQSRSYSSKSGIAVEDLKRKLASEGKKFADAVEMALKGLPVFLFRLLEIQSGLLRLRIILETLFHNNGDGKANNNTLRKEWGKTSRKITEILDLEGFLSWHKLVREDKQIGKHVDISEALKLLDVLMGESQKFPKCLLADRTWIGYNKSNWYQKVVRMNQKKNVRKDFGTFARAVDIVLKEAQTLSPHSLDQTKADSEGYQA